MLTHRKTVKSTTSYRLHILSVPHVETFLNFMTLHYFRSGLLLQEILTCAEDPFTNIAINKHFVPCNSFTLTILSTFHLSIHTKVTKVASTSSTYSHFSLRLNTKSSYSRFVVPLLLVMDSKKVFANPRIGPKKHCATKSLTSAHKSE